MTARPKEKVTETISFRTTKERSAWLDAQAKAADRPVSWVVNWLLDAAQESGLSVEEHVDNAALWRATAKRLEEENASLRAALESHGGSGPSPPESGTGPPQLNEEGAREGHGGRGRG